MSYNLYIIYIRETLTMGVFFKRQRPLLRFVLIFFCLYVPYTLNFFSFISTNEYRKDRTHTHMILYLKNVIYVYLQCIMCIIYTIDPVYFKALHTARTHTRIHCHTKIYSLPHACSINFKWRAQQCTREFIIQHYYYMRAPRHLNNIIIVLSSVGVEKYAYCVRM